MLRRTTAVALLASLLLAACGSDGGGAAPSPTVAPTVAPTSAPGTSPATSACGLEGDTARKADGFPDRLSGLVGADVRYAVLDECTERFVVELQGTGSFPGWQAMYESDPVMGESEEPVEIAGKAILVATLGSWMTDMTGAGYDGPTDITAKGTRAIQQLKMIENFEGVTRWAIGLDTKRPFTVTVLDGPPRLVVDVAVSR